MIHVDSFMTQGKSHKVCEDYALSANNEFHLFSVSDGCSSSKNTDFGSRILSKVLESSIQFPMFNGMTDDIILPLSVNLWMKSNDVVHLLKMDNKCLDATLVFGYVKDGKVMITMIGDGCFVVEDQTGMIKYFDVEYDQNAPFYLSYMFDKDRETAYRALNQIKKVTTTIYWSDGTESTGSHNSSNDIERFAFDLNNVKTISLFTDGVKSLIPNNQKTPKKPIKEVINDLVHFPVPNGEFVNRRCLKFIKTNPDYSFFDDFSMATLVNGD